MPKLIYLYVGDRLLAVFENDSPGAAALDAIKAGLEMLATIERMQPYLEQNYGQNLQIGIGIHCDTSFCVGLRT